MTYKLLDDEPQAKPKQKGYVVLDDYDPTEGMSGAEKALAGGGKAAVDLWRGIKQIAGIGDQEALQREIDESKRLDAPLMNTGAGLAGNIGMNFAMTAVPGGAAVKVMQMIPGVARALQAIQAARPFVSAVVPGAASGAAVAALDPVETGGSRETNAALGAAGGALGGAVARGAAKVLGGKAASESDALLREGVRLTPGQAIGGAAKRVEDAATSIPIVGDAIRGAQKRGMEDFNRAALNRALAPIAEKLEKGQPVGRDALELVENKIGHAYDKVLGKIKLVKLDNDFTDEVGKVVDMVTTDLPEATAKQFEKILEGKVFSKVTPAGTISADTMKIMESELGRLARANASTPDVDRRQLSAAIREVQSSLRRAVERSAPQHADELKSVNEAFANFVRVQRAASSVAAEHGVFTPAQLLNAVKAGDSSVRKGKFARGDALMQDLAENAKATLGSKVPDSGTATRLLASAGLLTGGGAMLDVDPMTMAGAGALALPYTRPGRAATLAILAKRPEMMRELAQVFERGAPYAGIAGGYLGLPSAQ
jgi:hypothetical protein